AQPAQTRRPRTRFPKKCGELLLLFCSFLHLRRLFDRLANSLIGPASADVAAHSGIDVGIRRLGLEFEQSRRLHDLPALTVSTLRNVALLPRHLKRMVSLR